MVAFALIGIGDGKGGDCLVEDIVLAEVPTDLCGLTGAGVGTRQRPAADLGVLEGRGNPGFFAFPGFSLASAHLSGMTPELCV